MAVQGRAGAIDRILWCWRRSLALRPSPLLAVATFAKFDANFTFAEPCPRVQCVAEETEERRDASEESGPEVLGKKARSRVTSVDESTWGIRTVWSVRIVQSLLCQTAARQVHD